MKKLFLISVVACILLTACSGRESVPTALPSVTPKPGSTATAKPAEEKVEVTCLNSDAVVVTKDGTRYGIVPDLPAPINNFAFYNPLQITGKFEKIDFVQHVSTVNNNGNISLQNVDDTLVIIPEGSTFEYNGNISVRNGDGAMIIVTDGVEETCVPKTTVVQVNGSYYSHRDISDPSQFNSCGNDAIAGDRILLAFTDEMIFLRKAEFKFTYEYIGRDFTKSATSNYFYFTARHTEYLNKDWLEYQTDIRVCRTNDLLSVEIDEYLAQRSYNGGSDGDMDVIDSNVCRKTNLDWIVVPWEDRGDADDWWSESLTFELDEKTGNTTVFTSKTDSLDVSRGWYIGDGYPPGKAFLGTYLDSDGTVKGTFLIENCGTFLSPIYK